MVAIAELGGEELTVGEVDWAADDVSVLPGGLALAVHPEARANTIREQTTERRACERMKSPKP